MLNHKGTITLETERLVLRRFEVADAEAMFKNWANDPAVTDFLTWQPHGAVENTRELLKSWVAEYEKPDYYHWIITLGGVPIGSLAVVGQNERNEVAEMGYCIGRAYWSKGYVTEALGAVIAFLFGTVGFHRVDAFHDQHNIGSGRVMQKCGMVKEGVKRDGWRHHNGEWHDLVCYGMLKSEWVKGWLRK